VRCHLLRISGSTAALLLAVLAPSARAGPPAHLALSGLDIGGLNHACGVAVDGEGDVYAASAGESKVRVFDEAHASLTSLSNAHEPCGLAVDSQGNLYVSERGTGEVVRYHPSEYPPSPSTSYTETTVDASGLADGIAVDPLDDSLYVAEGSRVTFYKSDGNLFTDDEAQRFAFTGTPTGGTYKLSFEGSETAPLAYNASGAQVQVALEGLATIGAGNITVAGNSTKSFTFGSALAAKNLPQIGVDASALVVSGAEITTTLNGFDGHLTGFAKATGVASYTYPGTENFHKRRYLSVADPESGQVEVFFGGFSTSSGAFLPGTLEAGATIDGSKTPDGELGLALTGAYLGADEATGHIFAYDSANKVVNEFEATGSYFASIPEPRQSPSPLDDAEPTAIAVDRSGGANDGDVYVSAGASTGAKLLAFGPLVEPGRADLPTLSHEFTKACGTAVDSEGDLYVAGTTKIAIYDRTGKELASFEDPEHPCALAVDSEGNLYAREEGSLLTTGDESVRLYEPSSYPFSGAPAYGPPKTIEKKEDHLFPLAPAVNPANDHLFISHEEGHGVREYGSAKDGSPLLKAGFCGVGGNTFGVGVYGGNGNVYVVSEADHAIDVCNAAGTKVLSVIDGSSNPEGPFSALGRIQIAVDQSNGHVLVGEMGPRGAVEEYEASGAFVAGFGSFTKTGALEARGDISIDNAGGANRGDLYVAYDDPANSSDLTALGPLSYGEPPVAVTRVASGVTETSASLNGSVDPNEAELEECAFEWGEVGHPYEPKELCAETPTQIGDGGDPVPVHLVVSGLEPETKHYRFRLLAKNKYGEDTGEEGRFGPPILTEKEAQPILYKEATLRGAIDPFGLATEYHFEYLTETEYLANGETFAGAHATPIHTLPASNTGPADVEAFLTGLAEGTTYRFRVVAANEAAPVEGSAQELTTQERPPRTECKNETLRLENNSLNLPDCRAYELVTPADTPGAPHAEEGSVFNDWLVTPSGPLTGDSLAFALAFATLPGSEGNGLREGFRATRDAEAGWSSVSFGPSPAQIGDPSSNGEPANLGTAADQLYSFWTMGQPGTPAPGALAYGKYLRTPLGFEVLGRGSIGEELAAEPDYLSAGGTHVIFSSKGRLEPESAPEGTTAIYDRAAGSSSAQVVSLKPDGSPFSASEGAVYEGATENGSSIIFRVAGSLYLHRDGGQTVKVADFPASFAGVSADSERVFYTDEQDPQKAADLRVCELDAGPCPGSSALIATDAKFVNVSADGSRAYFTSEEEIGGEGVLGAHNLYVWSNSGTKFVAVLDPRDFPQGGVVPFPGTAPLEEVSLDAWTAWCVGRSSASRGRATCPSRTTPDGRFLVFQSHADLTPPYESDGHSEVYRYDALGGSLLCVSCDPSGVPASAEADLQAFPWEGGPDKGAVQSTTLIPGVSEDGGEVFFQTAAALLPEDANSVLDVYEWRAQGSGNCVRAMGCLALISSWQGDNPSAIYSMTPDGHDVFFSTLEKLVDSDIAGSPSIYDARVDGGFPQPVEAEPCHGDACQGAGTPSPAQPVVRSDVPNSGNVEEPGEPLGRCPKGKRKVRKAGKSRCVKQHHHKRHRRAKAKRRAGR